MLLPIRAAHPVANRGASGAVFWKDARHLAPSPWLLAVGWHRNVSFLFFFKTQMEREALEKSFNYLRPAGAAVAGLIFTNCGERYKTTLSAQTCLRFFIWSTLWGSVLTFVFFLDWESISDMAMRAGKTFRTTRATLFWTSPSRRRCIRATTWRWRTSSWLAASRQSESFCFFNWIY